MEKSGSGNRLKKFFVTTLAMLAFTKQATSKQIAAGSPHGGGSWGGAPIYNNGKQMRIKHFNKKRNGKRLQRKHRKAA
jgi:hypothetical protein